MRQNYQGRAVGLTSVGSYIPAKILTNFHLEKMVETDDQWIRKRTGIEERRISADDMAASDLAIIASRRALEKAEISPNKLDLIIVATATPDMLFPATACLVQSQIGATNAAAFDLEIGCAGFLYALAVGSQFIANNAYDNVLIIGSEVLSRIVDWKDRQTCVLFGDGAGAVLLQSTNSGDGILSLVLGADGSGAEMLKMPAGGSRMPASPETVSQNLHYVKMNGRDVFEFAVKKMSQCTLQALEQCNLSVDEVDCFIPHQANYRIIKAVANRLNLPMEKVFININKYGNTSAASIPIALDEAVQEGIISDGNLVVLASFGAGLGWAASVLRWRSTASCANTI